MKWYLITFTLNHTKLHFAHAKSSFVSYFVPSKWPNYPFSKFLLPQENVDIVKILPEQEANCGTKLTPAVQAGCEAVYRKV